MISLAYPRTKSCWKHVSWIHVEVFWAVMPCSVAVGEQRFGWSCCLHLQGVVAWRWR